MTALRLAHTPRHSTDTRRDETPTPACAGSWDLYDALIDGDASEVRFAVPAARTMCGGCALQTSCFQENRDELWVQTIIQGYRRKGRAVEPKKQTPAGEALRGRWAEKNDARKADLAAFMAAGMSLEEICDRFGITESGLWKWTRNHVPGAWAELTADRVQGNQYRADRRDQITLRTRRKKEAEAA